jgi:hypothetical protein
LIQPGSFDGFPNINEIWLNDCDLSAEGIPDDLFVNITPVTVKLFDNPRLTEAPPACDVEGVTCEM